MFMQHLLSLQFFQRKEIAFRQLQQLHAWIGLVPDGPQSACFCPLHTKLSGHLEYHQAGHCVTHRQFAATEGIAALVDDSNSFKVTFVTIRRGAGIRAIQALNLSPKKGMLANSGACQQKLLKTFSKSTKPI